MELPSPGTKIVRRHDHYRVVDIGEDEVRLSTRYAGQEQEVTVTRNRFEADLRDGVAVVHPNCSYCDLPVSPEEAADGEEVGFEGEIHYQCWFQHADVAERCEAEVERSSGNRLAAEALRADASPKEYLLEVIGDPARSLHDRNDAENLLSHAVDVSTLVEASVRCPECLEGEAFEMDPSTGAVTCHCGELLKPAESA